MRNLLEHRTLLFAALSVTILITWLSTARIFIPIEIGVENSDKFGHSLAYFTLTVVWFLFFFYSKKQNRSFWKAIFLASVLSFFYGILMEACQFLITDYRTSDWYDVLANTSGIIIAISILGVLKPKIISMKYSEE